MRAVRPVQHTAVVSERSAGEEGKPRQARGRRRTRLPGGRVHQVKVRLSDQEYIEVAARAAAAGLTPASFLALSGRLSGDRPGPVQFRALATELLGVRRLVSGVARNVNQVAAAVNSGVRPAETAAVLAASERILGRLDGVLAGLDRHVPVKAGEGS